MRPRPAGASIGSGVSRTAGIVSASLFGAGRRRALLRPILAAPFRVAGILEVVVALLVLARLVHPAVACAAVASHVGPPRVRSSGSRTRSKRFLTTTRAVSSVSWRA
jgi:hypothetical protein